MNYCDIYCEECGEPFETHDERDNPLICEDCEDRNHEAEFVDSFYN